ncbi:hypothetical protein MRB53_037824 [Persea americana]|nr:hypothetical protein MRB53_037824 [Persea americana]
MIIGTRRVPREVPRADKTYEGVPCGIPSVGTVPNSWIWGQRDVEDRPEMTGRGWDATAEHMHQERSPTGPNVSQKAWFRLHISTRPSRGKISHLHSAITSKPWLECSGGAPVVFSGSLYIVSSCPFMLNLFQSQHPRGHVLEQGSCRTRHSMVAFVTIATKRSNVSNPA